MCGRNTVFIIFVVFSKRVSFFFFLLLAYFTPSTMLLVSFLSALLLVEGLSVCQSEKNAKVFDGSNVMAFSIECTERFLEKKHAVFWLYCRVVVYMTYISVKDCLRFCDVASASFNVPFHDKMGVLLFWYLRIALERQWNTSDLEHFHFLFLIHRSKLPNLVLVFFTRQVPGQTSTDQLTSG